MRQSRRWRRHFSGDNLLAKLKFINRPKRQAGRQADKATPAAAAVYFFLCCGKVPLATHTHSTHRTTKQSTKKPGKQAGEGGGGAEIEAMATTGT